MYDQIILEIIFFLTLKFSHSQKVGCTFTTWGSFVVGDRSSFQKYKPIGKNEEEEEEMLPWLTFLEVGEREALVII